MNNTFFVLLSPSLFIIIFFQYLLYIFSRWVNFYCIFKFRFLSSIIFILLLSPFSEFLILCIVFFSFNIFISVLLISSISLLISLFSFVSNFSETFLFNDGCFKILVRYFWYLCQLGLGICWFSLFIEVEIFLVLGMIFSCIWIFWCYVGFWILLNVYFANSHPVEVYSAQVRVGVDV